MDDEGRPEGLSGGIDGIDTVLAVPTRTSPRRRAYSPPRLGQPTSPSRLGASTSIGDVSSRRAMHATSAPGLSPREPGLLVTPRLLPTNAQQQLSTTLSGNPSSASPSPKRPTTIEPGDKVEYWSVTHKQWMQGIVLKVRDGGSVCDLDIKRGAHVARLRIPEGCGTHLDGCTGSEHMSATPRRNQRAHSYGHQVTAFGVADNASGSFAGDVDTMATGEEFAVSTQQRRSPRGRGQPSMDEKLAESPGVQGSSALQASARNHTGAPRSSAQSGKSPIMHSKRSPRSMGAVSSVHELIKASHAELIQLTDAGRTSSSDWDGLLEADLMSKAGGVAVRRMLLATKSLLHGLEESLMRRSGLVARAFCAWRSENTMRSIMEGYESQLAQLKAHTSTRQRHLEDQLRLHGEHVMSYKGRVRQRNALLCDKWMYGDRLGLLRESHRAWRNYAKHHKSAKATAASIHAVVKQWARGRLQGTAIECLRGWHTVSASEAMTRQREHELCSAWASKLQQQLQCAEARHREGVRNVVRVFASWEKGGTRFFLSMIYNAWNNFSNQSQRLNRCCDTVDRRLQGWAERMVLGDVHSCFLFWKSSTVDVGASHRLHIVSKEVERLMCLLTQEEGRHRLQCERQTSAVERHHQHARLVIQSMMAKWDMGEKSSLLKSYIWGWVGIARELKRQYRQRQKVHDVIARSLQGNTMGSLRIALVSWLALVKATRHNSATEDLLQQRSCMEQFLQQSQAEHNSAMEDVQQSVAALRAEAHAACDRARQLEFQVAQLEEQRGNLQEQLMHSFNQIDHITATLQKELRSKEEMAVELRAAYSGTWTRPPIPDRRPLNVTDPGFSSTLVSDLVSDPVTLSPDGSDGTLDLASEALLG
mmetsp:Transcript_57838/g.146734  ORF Transcript_57838/g.146734 Transcript_57838/m.146734 type:complete len:875 (-) Transcript_57838:159-2783(-)